MFTMAWFLKLLDVFADWLAALFCMMPFWVSPRFEVPWLTIQVSLGGPPARGPPV